MSVPPRIAAAAIVAGLLAGGAQADQSEPLLEGGSYEVTVRVEIPNVWNWSARKRTTICVAEALHPAEPPLPVLSGNNPFSGCPARNVERSGSSLTFDIVCEGRDASKARAAYTLKPEAFQGRIRMVMGAKNMTMTEVQTGRRVGSCDLAGAPPS